MTFLCRENSSAPAHDGAHVPASDASSPSQLVDNSLDPTSAMKHRYPRATRAQVLAFASQFQCKVAASPAFILMMAAINKEWGILHEFIEANTALNNYALLDIHEPYLPWIFKYFSSMPANYNGNMFMAVCAYTGNLTILRYVVEHRNALGISTLGLVVVPAIQMQNEHFDAAFWLLENLPLTVQDYTEACGFMLNTFFSYEQDDQRLRLAAAMQRKGATGLKLLTMFASMPHVLSLRDDVNDLNDPKTAMLQKYPMADMKAVMYFASLVLPNESDHLPLVLHYATAYREWNIVHTLLDIGVKPNLCRGITRIKELDVLVNAIKEDSSSCSSNVLLAATAFAGEFTVLDYMLSLQPQIQYTSLVYPWLPYAAHIGGHFSLAHWLLYNLPFGDSKMETAFERVIILAAKCGEIHAAAVYLNMVCDLSECFDLQCIATAYLKANVSSLGVVKAIINESSFPEYILVGAAIEVLPTAAAKYCHETYKWLLKYIKLIDKNQIKINERLIQNIVTHQSLAQLQENLAANSASNNYNTLIYRALDKAVELGKIDMIKYLLGVQPAASKVLKEYCIDLLLQAATSNDAEVLTLINAHAPRDNIEEYINMLLVFFMHVLATLHISFALPILRAEQCGPLRDRVFRAVVLSTSKYGTPDELNIILSMALPNVHQNLFSDVLQTAIYLTSGDINIVHTKLDICLQLAEQNEALYSIALQESFMYAAKHDSINCISYLMIIAKWRSNEERQVLLSIAAERACALGNANVLKMLLDKCIQVPAEVRMKWPFHINTYSLALHGILTERLLLAQLQAAESENGANYLLVRQGLRVSRPNEAQLAASLEADIRHRAYLKRITRSQNGIKEADILCVCRVIDIGMHDSTALVSELCRICCKPLVASMSSDRVTKFDAAASNDKNVIDDSAEQNPANQSANTTGNIERRVKALVVHNLHDHNSHYESLSNVLAEESHDRDSTDGLVLLKEAVDVLTVVCLQCDGGHMFHYECVLEWFAKNTMCPTCEQDLRPLVKSTGPIERDIS